MSCTHARASSIISISAAQGVAGRVVSFSHPYDAATSLTGSGMPLRGSEGPMRARRRASRHAPAASRRATTSSGCMVAPAGLGRRGAPDEVGADGPDGLAVAVGGADTRLDGVLDGG